MKTRNYFLRTTNPSEDKVGVGYLVLENVGALEYLIYAGKTRFVFFYDINDPGYENQMDEIKLMSSGYALEQKEVDDAKLNKIVSIYREMRELGQKRTEIMGLEKALSEERERLNESNAINLI
jgi:hypothetical protein